MGSQGLFGAKTTYTSHTSVSSKGGQIMYLFFSHAKKCSNGDFLIVEYTVIKLLEGWIPSYFESSLYIFRKKCLSSAKITIFFFQRAR